MSFEKTLSHTLTFEGGYVNDPADSGGETFRGVSRRNNPNWAGWPLIDAAKKSVGTSAAAINKFFQGNQNMADLVASIYQQNYYAPVAKLGAPELATDKAFDAAVNVGVGQAVKFAQAIVGTAADGAIGPKTLAAVADYFRQSGAVGKFLAAFCKAQEAFYRGIVSRKPSQAKFLNGWLRRAAWLPE